jgi:hypothetical protein
VCSPLFVLADEATRWVRLITFGAGGDVPPLYSPQNERREQQCSLPYWPPRVLRSKQLTW